MIMRNIWEKALAAALLASLTSVGCSNDNNNGPTTPTKQPLTYWQDVAPIMFQHCVACHQDGGIGPFRLDNYADAKKWGTAAATMTMTGRMPPYLATHDGTCGDFQAGETLTDAQKQIIFDWGTGAQAEGTPVTLSVPPVPALAGAQSVKTPMFSPVPQGGMLAQFDEYRCFLLDTGLTKEQFITGYHVIPGNKNIVHHVIGMVVDPAKPSSAKPGMTNAQVMKALDDESPDRLGWPCFGSAGEGVDVDSLPVGWAPGQGIVDFPAGMGVRVRPTDKFVVQIHYNLADSKNLGMSDSSDVRLRFADKVDRQLAFLFPDPLLNSLKRKTADMMPAPPDLLPAGQKSYVYTWNLSGKEMGLGPNLSVDLVAVSPHMHERGRKLEMHMTEAGVDRCGVQVPAWNFGWQRTYFYKEPIKIGAATQFRVSCDYDTSGDTNPVYPGWGTRNEMCLTLLMVALPPGVGQ
jgi:hypothetical protein